jgi:hypothetical protein
MGADAASWQRGLIAGVTTWALTFAVQAHDTHDAHDVALHWVRLEGAETCSDAAELAKLVQARLERPVLHDTNLAQSSIEARVGAEPGGGYFASIALHASDGTVLGERELKVSGPCSRLDRPASLIISLLLDSEASSARATPGAGEQDAQNSPEQLDPPSTDASAPPTSATKSNSIARTTTPQSAGARRVLRVTEIEWEQQEAQHHNATVRDAPPSITPSWPGYALLGLAGLGVATAIYSPLRLNALNHDPSFTTYRNAAALPDRATNVCVEARAGNSLGLDASVRAGAVRTCDEAGVLEVLFWVSAATALLGAAAGASWLIWTSDDGAQADKHRSSASISLVPDKLGAALRLRM